MNFISEEKKQNYTHPNAYTLHHSHRLSCTESATWRETQGLHLRWGTLLWRAIALSVLMLSSFSMGSCVSHHSAVSSAGVKGLFLCYGLLCSLVYIYMCVYAVFALQFPETFILKCPAEARTSYSDTLKQTTALTMTLSSLGFIEVFNFLTVCHRKLSPLLKLKQGQLSTLLLE